MQPEVLLISRTTIDFNTFLGVAMKVLGRSLSADVDTSALEMGEGGRFLRCLATMSRATMGGATVLNPKLLPHVSVGALVVADEVDLLDILECAAGMPFTKTETVARNVYIAIITGTLAQWRAAVVAGTSPECETTVRFAYNKFHGLFRAEFLNLWPDFQQQPAQDHVTFLLEDKRGR